MHVATTATPAYLHAIKINPPLLFILFCMHAAHTIHTLGTLGTLGTLLPSDFTLERTAVSQEHLHARWSNACIVQTSESMNHHCQAVCRSAFAVAGPVCWYVGLSNTSRKP